jgi:chromosomal replication initiator protein
VVGNSNNYAHAAALAVAESPGTIYNPLYIYGEPGLGKTHLMHAIGHFILNNNQNMKVLFVTSDEFTDEVMSFVRAGDTKLIEEIKSKIRKKYRNIDVLLYDDVQKLIGKEMTQEEFFHIFNTLHTSGKQIVLTSDKPPKELKTLHERYISRFNWGLIADMQPPDYETRMAILQKNVEMQHRNIEMSVLDYIAKNITSNVRDLEGALKKIYNYTKVQKDGFNLDDIEKTLKDIIYDNKNQEVTPQLIINIVAEHFNVTADDIISTRRNQQFVLPRQLVMYLCRELTSYSYDHIAKTLGNKDHSTIMHGEKKIAKDIQTNEEIKNKVETIKKLVSPSISGK